MSKFSQEFIKVSVCVVTYNQEKYIHQCLQSIVDQKTDFDFEVIVADDCSTDGTRAIIEEFAVANPKVVIPIFHTANIGALKNFIFVHNQAKGKYIAHMDGDDYALPGKLMAQAGYLDVHDSCNIVWHRVNIENGLCGELVNDFNEHTIIKDVEFSRKDILLIGSIGCHSSKMYRSRSDRFQLHETECIDFFKDVEQVGDGYATVLENTYGVYRKGIGVSSQQTTKIIYLSHLERFIKQFPEFKYQIAANAFIVFLADIKNMRPEWRVSLKIWTRVNPIFMCAKLVEFYFKYKNLRSVTK